MDYSRLERQLAQRQRRQVRRVNLEQRVSGIRVPGVTGVEVKPALEGQAGAVATDGTAIYSQFGRPDRVAMAHEMAHILDTKYMTDADRKRFAMIMGKPKKPWERFETNGGFQTTTHDSLSERFADMTAMLATRKFPRPGRGGGFPYLDTPPRMRELLRFGRALERLGKRYDLARYQRPR